jgi:hypothetical protein
MMKIAKEELGVVVWGILDPDRPPRLFGHDCLPIDAT